MKKFKNLNIGNNIYLCNFKRCEITKYIVVNIEDSLYDNQILLSLQKYRENTYSYYPEYVNEQINVFSDKSYEPKRNIIGRDDDTVWCADKHAIQQLFEQYQNKERERLKKIQNEISHIT